jgi:hypothetical protein
MMRKRSAEPKESVIDALINDEIGKMTSLVDDEGNPGQPQTAEGSMSLDPGAFVDTSNWVGELGMQSQQAPPMKRPTRPPPMGKAHRSSHPTPAPGDIGSLEQMLEPDRTGIHGKAEKKTNWLLIIIVMIVLAGGAAAAVVMLMT